jgi:cation-transporting P-type ATPase E
MVRALQANGHTVAMTGDGVNDVLALKAADLGVAMGSGAPATRGVAQLVLLDGRFATLPGVVAEGRRVTANIERVSNLFVTKTVWAALLALSIGLARWPYPFLPRHLSVIDSLTIGVPAFVLALAPNTRRYIPGFVDRVLRFTIPVGILVGLCIFTMFAIARGLGTSLSEQRTAATIVGLTLSLGVLVLLARPLTMWRMLLVAAVVVAFISLFAIEPASRFLDLQTSSALVIPCIAVAVVGLGSLAAAGATRSAPRRSQR